MGSGGHNDDRDGHGVHDVHNGVRDVDNDGHDDRNGDLNLYNHLIGNKKVFWLCFVSRTTN